MERYDTTLEAAGAEMLVIGRLLIERLQSFKAYANQPGYDLLVVNPAGGLSLKVQVKSRTATDAGGFKIESLDFDFAILVRLNRGTKASLKSGVADNTLDPEFYVFPKHELIARGLMNRKFRLSAVADAQDYKDAWHLLIHALKSSTRLPNSDPVEVEGPSAQ